MQTYILTEKYIYTLLKQTKTKIYKKTQTHLSTQLERKRCLQSYKHNTEQLSDRQKKPATIPSIKIGSFYFTNKCNVRLNKVFHNCKVLKFVLYNYRFS